MRMFVYGLAAALAALSPAAGAMAADGLEQRSLPAVDDGLRAIRVGQPQRALDLVEPVLADFEKAYAGQSRIYCADTVQEAGAYAVPTSDGGASLQPAPPGSKPDTVAARIVINSVWCKAQYVRAFALVDLGRFDEAQAGFERLIKFAPRRSRYLSELGYLFQRKRQFQTSIDYYTRAEASADLLAPADRDYERCVALRGMGFGLIELGRWDEAEGVFKKCLAITPGEPKSLNELEYIRQQRLRTT